MCWKAFRSISPASRALLGSLYSANSTSSTLMLSLASSSLTVSHCWLLAPTTPTLTTVGSAVGAELPVEPEPDLEPETGLELPPFPPLFPPQAARDRARAAASARAKMFFFFILSSSFSGANIPLSRFKGGRTDKVSGSPFWRYSRLRLGRCSPKRR